MTPQRLNFPVSDLAANNNRPIWVRITPISRLNRYPTNGAKRTLKPNDFVKNGFEKTKIKTRTKTPGSKW